MGPDEAERLFYTESSNEDPGEGEDTEDEDDEEKWLVANLLAQLDSGNGDGDGRFEQPGGCINGQRPPELPPPLLPLPYLPVPQSPTRFQLPPQQPSGQLIQLPQPQIGSIDFNYPPSQPQFPGSTRQNEPLNGGNFPGDARLMGGGRPRPLIGSPPPIGGSPLSLVGSPLPLPLAPSQPILLGSAYRPPHVELARHSAVPIGSQQASQSTHPGLARLPPAQVQTSHHQWRHPPVLPGSLSNSLFIRHLRKRSLREASPLQPFSR
jgi:hypothetical protein